MSAALSTQGQWPGLQTLYPVRRGTGSNPAVAASRAVSVSTMETVTGLASRSVPSCLDLAHHHQQRHHHRQASDCRRPHSRLRMQRQQRETPRCSCRSTLAGAAASGTAQLLRYASASYRTQLVAVCEPGLSQPSPAADRFNRSASATQKSSVGRRLHGIPVPKQMALVGVSPGGINCAQRQVRSSAGSAALAFFSMLPRSRASLLDPPFERGLLEGMLGGRAERLSGSTAASSLQPVTGLFPGGERRSVTSLRAAASSNSSSSGGSGSGRGEDSDRAVHSNLGPTRSAPEQKQQQTGRVSSFAKAVSSRWPLKQLAGRLRPPRPPPVASSPPRAAGAAPGSSPPSASPTPPPSQASRERGAASSRGLPTSPAAGSPKPSQAGTSGPDSNRSSTATSAAASGSWSFPFPSFKPPPRPPKPSVASQPPSKPASDASSNPSSSSSTSEVRASAGVQEEDQPLGPTLRKLPYSDSDLLPQRALPLPMTHPTSPPIPREEIEEMLSCDPEIQQCKEVIYQWTSKCTRCGGSGVGGSSSRSRGRGKKSSYYPLSTCIACSGIGYVYRFTVRDDIPVMGDSDKRL